MKLVSTARNSEELKIVAQSGAVEVLLGHEHLSRLGKLTHAELDALAKEAHTLKLRPILEWDILMTHPEFDRAVGVIKETNLKLFSAIRVQDPGAYEYALKHLSPLPIQLNLETGNQNLEGIQTWCKQGGTRLERIILSNQLPKSKLAYMIENVSVAVEVMGLGPILLLYTPRHLLTNQYTPTKDDPWLRALASSEEDFHAGFRIIENPHGTFVFHSKDYCLVDQIEELEKINLDSFRVDYRLEESNQSLLKIADFLKEKSQALAQAFIEQHPNKVTRCFFQANATDVLFKKLKNTKVQRQDTQYVGEVVEASKDSHLIIHVLGKGVSLKKGQNLRMINPEGTEKEYLIERLRDLDRQETEEVTQGDFALLPYIKAMPPKSAVYFK